MKKTLFITLLTTMVFTVAAQDTVDLHDMYKNTDYFIYDTIDGPVFFPESFAGPLAGGGEGGKYFFSNKDSLTIYGIAASVKVLGEDSHSPELFNYDTTDSHFYEYLRLYEPEPDSLRWVRQTKVQPYHTPVAYYFSFTRWPNTPYCIPMYECYFDSITVTDSFYLGMTFWSQLPFQDSNGTTMYNRGYIGLNGVGTQHYSSTGYNEPWFLCFYNTGGWYATGQREWRRISHIDYSFIYPILTPNPDTTSTVDPGIDTNTTDDTLGVTEIRLVDRLTGILPNPAAEKARVVSSFGLTLVEVYSPSGELVHSQRADGLHLDLDVSRWPAGTYLLRIHTPMGATIKKLTVAR